jgi:hypothetical protein
VLIERCASHATGSACVQSSLEFDVVEYQCTVRYNAGRCNISQKLTQPEGHSSILLNLLSDKQAKRVCLPCLTFGSCLPGEHELVVGWLALGAAPRWLLQTSVAPKLQQMSSNCFKFKICPLLCRTEQKYNFVTENNNIIPIITRRRFDSCTGLWKSEAVYERPITTAPNHNDHTLWVWF